MNIPTPPPPAAPVLLECLSPPRLRTRLILALVLTGVAARETAAKEKSGSYFTLAMTAGEVSAPVKTSTTDLVSFTGLGVAPAFGYRWPPYRLEGELHLHHAEAMFHGDSVGFTAFLLNGYRDFRLTKRLRLFAGAGAGYARVKVDFGTCLDLAGCTWPWTTEDTKGALAYQFTFGLDWWNLWRGHIFGALRQFYTADLGLRDASGLGFETDRVEMPMAVMGYRWIY